MPENILRVIWRVIKRTGEFIGSVVVIVWGAGLGIEGVSEARLSDAKITELLKATGMHQSVTDWRDTQLMAFGIGVVVVIWGLFLVHQWFRSLWGRP
jgi:hypothetical protein